GEGQGGGQQADYDQGSRDEFDVFLPACKEIKGGKEQPATGCQHDKPFHGHTVIVDPLPDSQKKQGRKGQHDPVEGLSVPVDPLVAGSVPDGKDQQKRQDTEDGESDNEIGHPSAGQVPLDQDLQFIGQQNDHVNAY